MRGESARDLPARSAPDAQWSDCELSTRLSSLPLSFSGQLWIVLYSAVRITISLLLYLAVSCAFRVHDLLDAVFLFCHRWTSWHLPTVEAIRIKKQTLDQARTLSKWQQAAIELDTSGEGGGELECMRSGA